jgi:hypothetical protein
LCGDERRIEPSAAGRAATDEPVESRRGINIFALHAAPKSFHEHVVDPAAFAVHTDLDAVRFEHVGEVARSERAALIDVEDLRCTVLSNGLLEHLDQSGLNTSVQWRLRKAQRIMSSTMLA